MEENNEQKLTTMYKLNFNTALSHLIGNITMVAVEHYMEQFPKNFFNSYYINTTMKSREFIKKRDSIVNLKQRKPIISVNPNVSTEIPEFATTSYFNNSFGKNIYSPRYGNPATSTLFFNKENMLILEFSINRMMMTLEVVHTYETLIQQINALGIMKSSMRIEHPYRVTSLIEVPIPDKLIDEVIERMNLKDRNIVEIKEILNRFSFNPIVYKLQTSTGKYKFFFEININLQIKLENPSLSDGDTKGMTNSDYEISQTVNLEFNYPDTFYYITDRPISPMLSNMDVDELMGRATLVPVLSTRLGLSIPGTNSTGKTFYTSSEILMDEVNMDTDSDVTNLTGMLTVFDFEVLQSLADNSNSKVYEVFDKYYEIEVYKDDEKMEKGKEFNFDSKTMDLSIIKPDMFSQYCVLIYRDNLNLNSSLHKLNNYYEK